MIDANAHPRSKTKSNFSEKKYLNINKVQFLCFITQIVVFLEIRKYNFLCFNDNNSQIVYFQTKCYDNNDVMVVYYRFKLISF